MNTCDLLKRVPAFSQLAADQLTLLARGVHLQLLQRDAPIFHQGVAGSTLYIIVEGQVCIYTTSPDGQELTIAIFHGGDFFGEMALLDGQPRAASAVTLCKTTLLTLQRDTFLAAIATCPSIAVSMLEAMVIRLRQTNTAAEQLACLTAPQRVVHQLLELAARYGIADGAVIRIDLRLTQDGLASLAGTTRETVNRVLAKLRDQGWIKVERARVSVLQLEQLEAHELLSMA